MRRRIAALSAFLLATLLTPAVPGGPSLPSAQAYPGSHVHLEGAGWGHGRGMGQYGALGYAIDHNWTADQILAHFYGNTSKGDIGNPAIRVRLIAFDGRDTIATSPGGVTTSVTGGTVYSAVLVRKKGSTYHVYKAGGCGGSWDKVAERTISDSQRPGVKIFGAGGHLVRACEPDGTTRDYRGELWATHDSEGPQRTVNRVAMESYLRGVVPRESPASWGDLDGGRGMHALRAQAVAARSYAASESRYSYADTCDTTACQVYKGAWDSTFGDREPPQTNTAISDTKGDVRTRGGVPVRTEFSSSTGGHTTGSSFPNVRDDGDDVSLNPNHRWTAKVGVKTIEGAYPEIGGLRSVRVTQRDGKGAWGGRVQKVELRGTQGQVEITGNTFRSRFNLKSDWFRVVNNPSGGIKGYWVLDTQGGIFSFGEAKFHGSVPALRDAGVKIGRTDIMGIAGTPDGDGYWVLDRAGGIFSFGDAKFYGSVPALRDQGVRIGRADIIGMAPTPSGKGYWILDSAGGMFSFGDANFHGSVPGLRGAGVKIGRTEIAAMTPTASGNGYWILDAVGGMFAFGDAKFFGSIPGSGLSGRAIAMVGTSTGSGYLIAMAEGGAVHPFGDAPAFGGVRDALGLNVTGRGIAIVPR